MRGREDPEPEWLHPGSREAKSPPEDYSVLPQLWISAEFPKPSARREVVAAGGRDGDAQAWAEPSLDAAGLV